MDAHEVIERLGMRRHPEGGWYAETWRAPGPAPAAADDGRPAGSAIYYLLAAGETSHWHRIDATEIWHYYAGAPLALRISPDDRGPAAETRLGPDLTSGERPQAVVSAGEWQAACSLGAWTLVGCTVSPAFDFGGFELAPPDWEPGAG